MAKGIRPKAICVFRRGDEILAALGSDPAVEDEFFIPPGGQFPMEKPIVDVLESVPREAYEGNPVPAICYRGARAAGRPADQPPATVGCSGLLGTSIGARRHGALRIRDVCRQYGGGIIPPGRVWPNCDANVRPPL